MKVVILSSLPRIDRHAYKAYFLDRLLDRPWVRPEDVVLVYGRSRLRDYRRELTRMGLGEAFRKLPALVSRRGRRRAHEPADEPGDEPGRAPGRAPDPERVDGPVPPAPAGTIASLARRRGVRVEVFDALGSQACLSLLRELRADTIHSLSGAMIPSSVLALADGPAGVVGGHYGLLPRLRGTDTVRWSVYLDVPMAVSHMALAPELDMGDVLSVRPVPVRRGDTYADVYRSCQFAVADGHLAVIDALRDGTLRRTPQRREDGSVFQRMGPFMRRQVDARLDRGEYGHYG